MSGAFLSAVHLGMLGASAIGLAALALATDRYGAHLLGHEPTPQQRQVSRVTGWVLLALALAWGIAMLDTGIGITIWLGWLGLAALSLVFALPKWPLRAAAAVTQPRRPAKPIAQTATFVPEFVSRRSTRMGRIGAWIALSLTVGGFSALLLEEQASARSQGHALQGKAGPWSFTLEEADHKPPELVAMDISMKTFRLRFCEACDAEIRQVSLKVNRPRGPGATGMAFIGQRWERKVEIPLPDTLRAESELWLTVVGKDASVYQVAWRMDHVSPSTVQWFEEQRKSHAMP